MLIIPMSQPLPFEKAERFQRLESQWSHHFPGVTNGIARLWMRRDFKGISKNCWVLSSAVLNASNFYISLPIEGHCDRYCFPCLSTEMLLLEYFWPPLTKLYRSCFSTTRVCQT